MSRYKELVSLRFDKFLHFTMAIAYCTSSEPLAIDHSVQCSPQEVHA